MKKALVVFAVTVVMGFIGMNIWGSIGGAAIAEAGANVFAIATVGGILMYDNRTKS